MKRGYNSALHFRGTTNPAGGVSPSLKAGKKGPTASRFKGVQRAPERRRVSFGPWHGGTSRRAEEKDGNAANAMTPDRRRGGQRARRDYSRADNQPVKRDVPATPGHAEIERKRQIIEPVTVWKKNQNDEFPFERCRPVNLILYISVPHTNLCDQKIK